MKQIIGLFALALAISCHQRKDLISQEQNCRQYFLKQLKEVSSFISFEDEKIYRFHHELIDVPPGYDTIKWQTPIEIETGLDSMYTKYMIMREKIKNLVSSKDACKLDKSDFIKELGQPTDKATGKYNSLIYHFNTMQYPDCVKKNGSPVIRYGDCSSLTFEFNSKDKLESVVTYYFYP